MCIRDSFQASASPVSVPPTAAVAGVLAAPPQGSGALKIILIAVCGLLLLAVISAAAIGFFAVPVSYTHLEGISTHHADVSGAGR